MPQIALLRFSDRANDSSVGAYLEKNELLTVGIALLLFLALCACIQSRYIPWGDEVQFVEPAANLYDKLGFISRQHSNQNDSTFWAANAPGYSTLLYLAFRTFQFSQLVARFVNYATMTMAVLFLWVAVRRSGFLTEPNTRVLMLALVLAGASCYPCYANIRYEGLSFLEFALAFLAYTVTRPAIRNSCLFVVGAAMSLTNLQFPQYVVALTLILTYAYSLRFTAIRRLLFLFLGLAAGGASLILLYASQPGALQAFSETLRQQAGQSVWEKLHDLHQYFEYDPSLLALLLFLVVSFAIVLVSPNAGVRRSIVAGLLICTLIPAFFFLARRFIFSSAWMVYVPAVLCVCRILEANISVSRKWKAFAAVCCVASIAFGLPKALLGIANDWEVRNYAVVDAFVAGSVAKQDIVFCEPAAYFAAKPRVARVYGPGYLEVMSAAEKALITVVIVNPEDRAQVLRGLGGKWTDIRRLVRESRSSPERLLPIPTNFSCRLDVLRRS